MNSRGFSLVEILVAMSVFSLMTVATMGTTASLSKQARHVANNERATILAEEALEAARNLRDAAPDFASLPDGSYGLSSVGNAWSLAGSSDTVGMFTRAITVSTINENQKKVDTTITWSDQASPSNSISMSTYLTNWHALLNLGAGLTVNKVVINHGGSKVAADFAPFYVGTTSIALGEGNVFSEGPYTISETVHADYTQSFSGDCASDGSITLTASSSFSCTITNEEKPSQLIVNKVVINHGGTKVASDFTLKVDTNPVIAGATNTFNSGVHTVSETPDPSYVTTIGGDCAVDGTVTLSPGTTKTCTVTNEEIIVLVAPTVTDPTATAIASTSATLGANVTSLGEPALITERGTCYGTSPNPTTNCLADGSTTTGVFTQARTGFTCGTTYYYRGYATNATGTGYSADGTFTTAACPVAPTVTTTAVTSITQTTALSGGNVTSDGGASVTARGVVWSTAVNPTIALPTKTTNGTGTGTFSSSITGVTCNTTYHVRAYATNSVGTSYGANVQFTTSACNVVPTVASPTATSITTTTATLGANVTSAGLPAPITERGICWGTSPAPTTNCTLEGGTSTGVFTLPVTGLTPGTTYYYRGYVTNSTGTGYSPDGTFTTSYPPCTTNFPNNQFYVCYFDGTSAPTTAAPALSQMVETTVPSPVGAWSGFNRDWAGGVVDGSGKTDVVSAVWRGTINFQEGAYVFHTVSDDGVEVIVSGAGTVIRRWTDHAATQDNSSSVYLTAGTRTVQMRWYENGGQAVSRLWWDYSPPAVPTVTSPTATSITTTSATLGANVTSLGVPASISARGICYGTSPNPTTNCTPQGGTTTGVFTQSITGLTPGTTYYYRGYAPNSTGTGYSADGRFTTSNAPGSIVVRKVVVNNNGGAKTASDFAPYRVGTTTVTLNATTTLPNGSYTISEVTDINYVQTFSGDCDASGSVTIVSGVTKTCTITNDDIPVERTFTITNTNAVDYRVDGVADPDITLQRGKRYVFNVNTPNHPFWIKNGPGRVTGTANAYNTGVQNNGTAVGQIIFDVPLSAPAGTLYYICEIHANMSANINTTP